MRGNGLQGALVHLCVREKEKGRERERERERETYLKEIPTHIITFFFPLPTLKSFLHTKMYSEAAELNVSGPQVKTQIHIRNNSCQFN